MDMKRMPISGMMPAATRNTDAATKAITVRKTSAITSFGVILMPTKAIAFSSSFFVPSSGGFTERILPEILASLSNQARRASSFFLKSLNSREVMVGCFSEEGKYSLWYLCM